MSLSHASFYIRYIGSPHHHMAYWGSHSGTVTKRAITRYKRCKVPHVFRRV